MSSNGSGPVLDLERAGVEETLKPLERASMLPPRSFTETSVLDWELEHLFGGGWICAGHASALAEPGAYLMRVIGDESVFVIAGEDGEPAASSTSAATAARASSRRPRARSGGGSAARTTPGPTTSTAA